MSLEPNPFFTHNEQAVINLQDANRALLLKIKQMEFLLSQAPMLNAPVDRASCAHSLVKYAYIHPETFYAATGFQFLNTKRPGIRVLPSPTEWLGTELMPKGQVIFTPNLMPGLELTRYETQLQPVPDPPEGV